MMTNDPAKAERTISAEDTWETNRAAKMMVKLTTIFAPEEMPSTKGPAMGLRKKVWSRNPDTDSAPPRIAARSIRGIRMLKMMRLSVEALISVSRAFPPRSRSLPAARRAPPVRRNTSPAGMSTLPVFTFSTSPQASRAVKRAVDSRNRLQTGSLPLFSFINTPPFPQKMGPPPKGRSHIAAYQASLGRPGPRPHCGSSCSRLQNAEKCLSMGGPSSGCSSRFPDSTSSRPSSPSHGQSRNGGLLRIPYGTRRGTLGDYSDPFARGSNPTSLLSPAVLFSPPGPLDSLAS